ncbi:hypothetical protein [Saccharopolyspora taberi]|uniref:Intersectin-EH binding protein Ibp1 n=1 Tax=Saccharopolyspora taberi TaxID=60895 RepID=A0ABN3VE54_9PSEU
MNTSVRLLGTGTIAAGALMTALAAPAGAAQGAAAEPAQGSAAEPAQGGGFPSGPIKIGSCSPAPELGPIGLKCVVSSEPGSSSAGGQEASAESENENEDA